MRALIDTHVFLWAISEPKRLSRSARRLLEEPGNELFISAASIWEMAIKVAYGRLRLPEDFGPFVTTRLRSLGLVALPIEARHAVRISSLPDHHRDPFDRMILAQALVEDLPVVTADRWVRQYDVEVVRA